ncbi:hypothetical protein FBQ97_13000 [Acidobacteria bacterium ACD]|nr:MAG: hypothetical protein EDX89_21185 [Acidobacteriota bacterium]MCE7958805.1 hypothetical protein [Acidobacteria bacterium ACB2]MDL1950714.1 hypothetical protein [Acidobacteria bacterium ACD]
MKPDEKGWTVGLTGCETISSRRQEKVGNAWVAVYGTAHIYFALAVDVLLRKAEGHWKYGSGTITRAALPRHDQSYTPPTVYKVKRIYLSDAASVTRLVGKPIGGWFEEPDSLKLFWPMPKVFKEPAVMVITDDAGQEKNAAYVSDHFLDYASEYTLHPGKGSEDFEHGFKGALDKAHTSFHFTYRAAA